MSYANYFADQNLQTNQNIKASKPKNSNKIYYIILSILSFFILILGIANVVVYITGSSNLGSGTGVLGPNGDNRTMALTAFEDLTKEEALAFLRAQTDVTGTLPENYVGKEITNSIIMNGNTLVSDLELIYSYDTIEDLKQMAQKKYSGFGSKRYDESNFEVKEYDYYAIVTPNRAKGATSCDYGYNNDCDSLLSFKRSYLDHHQEETTPNSYNDVFYLNTREPGIINYLLRVCTFFSRVGMGGGHGNIYSYVFEEQDDKYVLTVNNVGAGVNAELFKNPDNHTDDSEIYGINLYSRRFAADKSDGRIYTISTETGVVDYIKSFPITQEELQSLPGYGY